ncbi:hypothetical protein AHAS_Ahas05G0303700 [Arachis hypogaea]
MAHPPQKINLISCGPMAHISDIKLIRTDTTLDLSQKAEKGMLFRVQELFFYNQRLGCLFLFPRMWDMISNVLMNIALKVVPIIILTQSIQVLQIWIVF